MKCLYCNLENEFNKEHVIPRCLGTFPINPTINIVCKNCNSKIFSSLEAEFIEDSYEGILCQMLNLSGAKSVRIRENNIKLECSGLGDSFFNEIFPFLFEKNGDILVNIVPQVKIKNYFGNSGYQVFQVEQLKKILRDSKKSKTKKDEYEKIRRRLKSSEKKNDIAIFTLANTKEGNEIDEIIGMLKKFGLSYKENQRKNTPTQTGDNKTRINMNCTISHNFCRLIAKIAFNYFSFNVIEEGKQPVLYNKNFDKIKKFIINNENKKIKKEDIIKISNEPIIYHEKETGKRFLGHTIVFFEENNYIYSNISFLNGKSYKITLGKIPKILINSNFGCGHIFLPFDKTIQNLTQKPKEHPSNEEIKQSFGVFRRFNLQNK